jgi:hypothetical protein
MKSSIDIGVLPSWRMKRALECVEENIESRITAADIAQHSQAVRRNGSPRAG